MPDPTPDPTALRALAHPIRHRILDELSASGSLRAADVARELGIPANQASFHLRQLAKYGLVEEDPDAGRDRRDRVWRARSPEGFTLDVGDLEQDRSGRAAARVFMASRAARAHHLVDVAYGEDRTPGTHRATVETALRLTRDEAAELTTEISDLLERWAERTRASAAGERSTYVAHLAVVPRTALDASPSQDEA